MLWGAELFNRILAFMQEDIDSQGTSSKRLIREHWIPPRVMHGWSSDTSTNCISILELAFLLAALSFRQNTMGPQDS